MVRGLEKFRTHFAAYTDAYVLIGGTACVMVMEEAGIPFRATKDLDIVLYVEAVNKEFVTAFWKFISEGGYQHRQQSTGKEVFYRFHTPTHPDFPAMLELFSRISDTIKIESGGHLTPITLNEGVTSLSAILLDDSYYHFIHSGKREIQGLPIIGVEYLIPLKAGAFINLTDKKKNGEKIDEQDIRKHKNDVFRLYQLLSSNQEVQLPVKIENDMRTFLEFIALDQTITLKNFGVQQALPQVLSNLKSIYKISDSNLSLSSILTREKGSVLIQMVREILGSGVDINDTSLNRHRPLQLLIKASLDSRIKLELVKEFVALGADIHSPDNSGLTPYQTAVSITNKDICDFLATKGARRTVPEGLGYMQHYEMYLQIPPN